MAEISEVIEKVAGIVSNIEGISEQPTENKTIQALEDQVRSSFDVLKEGKTRFLFTLTAKQYKNGHVDAARYKDILNQNIKDELEKGLILLVLRDLGSATPLQISTKSNIPIGRMYAHIVALFKDGEIEITGETEDWLIFSRSEKERE